MEFSSTALGPLPPPSSLPPPPLPPLPPLPPFPSSSRTLDLSPLEFILALFAIITIPALIYTFFFSLKCPPSPLRRRRSGTLASNTDGISEAEVTSDVKYQKEAHVKDLGSECPVCLSVFADGEEIKQLSHCKHSFHASCIDMWLNSHSNCPICRASVPVKRPTGSAAAAAAAGSEDLRQGLPDAASLV